MVKGGQRMPQAQDRGKFMTWQGRPELPRQPLLLLLLLQPSEPRKAEEGKAQ